MKKILIGILTILAISGCADIAIGDKVVSGDDNRVTDSYNTYSEEQEQILEDGYTPDEAGVCESGFFYCSIEQKCLPSVDGATCSLGHTDEDEAEAEEINESEEL